MTRLVHRLISEEDAQDIIEYAFLAAFISVVAYGIVVTIGEDVVSIYTATQGTTSSAAGAAS
jgi:Flp pilus assembly pilin Flp